MKSLKILPGAINTASNLVKDAIAKSSLINATKSALGAVSSKSQVSISVSLKVTETSNQPKLIESTPLKIPKVQDKRDQVNAIIDDTDKHDVFISAMVDMLGNEKESSHITSSSSTAGQSSVDRAKLPPKMPPIYTSSENNYDDDSTYSSVPRLSRSSIYSRSKQLLRSLATSSSSASAVRQTVCLQKLNKHLLHYEEAVGACVAEGAIPLILRLRSTAQDRVLKGQINQSLSLLGYADPPKGKGIRILSIDGGGIRGVVILEVLRELEQLTGKPVHKMFDLICGVSTGAILSMLIGALKKDIDTCAEHYRLVSQSLFVSDFWRGTSRLIMTHAYYDSHAWEEILRKVYQDASLIDTTTDDDIPKIMAISASLLSPRIQPFVFRNYNLPVERMKFSDYSGSCKHKVWQAVRASTSAPGYFEDFVLDNHVHSDGGILINNPASIAIHEAQQLWPGEPIQCVVSLGTGRYVLPEAKDSDEASSSRSLGPSSLKAKITSLIDSATDTEITHRLLQDLLPHRSYFRFNPTLSEWLSLDEHRPEKLDQMKRDSLMYIRRNEYKMKQAALSVSRSRSSLQKVSDYAKLQYLMLH